MEGQDTKLGNAQTWKQGTRLIEQNFPNNVFPKFVQQVQFQRLFARKSCNLT